MRKNLTKAIIGSVFAAVFILGVVNHVPLVKIGEDDQTVKDGTVFEMPQEYIITDGIDIMVNRDNYVHTDDATVFGTLKDITYSGNKWFRFVISSIEDEEYAILLSSEVLIDSQVLKTQEADGLDAVELSYRTGYKIMLSEGDDITLYKTDENIWSFDLLKSTKQKEQEFAGTIKDYKFLPAAKQDGDIYISHIIVKNEEGETVELYPHNLRVKKISSEGELRVNYVGKVSGANFFDIDQSDDFALNISDNEKDYVLKTGMEINLVKKENTGYWELAEEIDTKIYEAIVEGFVFGHNGTDITSVDYINLDLENGESVQLAMRQTGALYAVPLGNYKKTYTYDGHTKNLTHIEPLDDWKMDLYYEDETVIEMSIGTTVWIYRNESGVYVMDYTYEINGTEE